MIEGFVDVTKAQTQEIRNSLEEDGKKLFRINNLSNFYGNSGKVISNMGENSFFEFQGNLIYRSPFSVNYDFSRGNKKPSINIADESDPGIIFDGNETYHLLVPMELYEASKLLALKAYLVDEITKNKRIWYTAIVNPIFGANLDDGSNLLCPYVLLDFDSINQVGDGIVFNKFGDLERELFKETMNENRRKLS